jgi:dihydrofolate reductase
MGGGLLAKSLFEADLIDEVGFNIHPVLLGSGIPVFHEMMHQVDLELIDCKTLKTGCVLVTYRVKHETEKKTRVARKTPRGKKSTST